MARADRLERMDTRRLELEEEYRAALIEALRECAGGQWGLFDHKQDRHQRAKVAPRIAALEELADAIADVRGRLDLEPFTLHDEFLAARGPAKAQAVGEPRQAQAGLERLDAA